VTSDPVVATTGSYGLVAAALAATGENHRQQRQGQDE
jgi:hypothetical protein